MGKGKGHTRRWYYLGLEGDIILRISGVRPARMYYCLQRIAERLPGKPYVFFNFFSSSLFVMNSTKFPLTVWR